MMIRRHLAWLSAAAFFASALAAPAAEPAEAPPAASLAAAVGEAPSLRAARLRADAARERRGAAGRLPDPTLEGMYSQTRQPMGGEQFPMWEVTLSQPLPKVGERAADRERADAVVSMAEADYAVMAGEMSADVAMAVAESDAARGRIALLEEQIVRAERVLAAMDARVSAGSGRSADRLLLQSRIADMRLMVDRETRMAEDALSDARGRLGIAPDQTTPVFSAPAPAEIDLANLPAARLAGSRAAEARAMAAMARASARPMTAVGLRFEREEQSMGNMDTVGVAFMTELPFRSRGYARAEERAARAEENAARADTDSALHRARAALSRAERAERLAESTRRLTGETLARIDTEYEALVRAAGAPASGMGAENSVLMVVELLERQTDARLQIIDAELAARVARAELWRHAPAALFAQP